MISSIVRASATSKRFADGFPLVSVGVCILNSLYACSYASCSSSSVGRLYASLLFISSCPNIWSIQFVGMCPFSKSVWVFFLMLWADRCFSPVFRKAVWIVVLSVLLFILVGFPFLYCTISGDFGVIVSGCSFLVPFLLCSKYSLIAVKDSSAKNVVTGSLVLILRVLYMMIFAFGFSKNGLQFIAQTSLAPSPESLIM